MALCYRLDTCFTHPSRRWVAFFFALVELFWFSGVQYGYNALIPIMKDQGIFGYLCQGNDCAQQEKMYSYAFIVSVVCQLCLIPLAGIFMDKAGLRLNKLVSTLLISVGLLMFAFTTARTSWLLFGAMGLLSYASLSSLISNHQISSHFPQVRAIVISLLNGAYDSSTAVFFIFDQTYPNVPIRTSFILLAVGTLICGTLMALFFLTQYSKDMSQFAGHKPEEPVECLAEKTDTSGPQEYDSGEDTVEAYTQSIITVRYPTLKSCFASLPFFLTSMSFMLGLLRFSFFLSQLKIQLQFAFDNDATTVDSLLQVSSAMAMCGFIISPVSGLIMVFSAKYYKRRLGEMLKRHRGEVNTSEFYYTHIRSLAPAIIVMAVSTTLLSCLLFVRHQEWVYYLAFICNMLLRSLLFSSTASMVILAFPITSYGTVYGVINLIGGLFSTLQYGMLELPIKISNGLCVLVSLLMFIPPLVFFFKKR